MHAYHADNILSVATVPLCALVWFHQCKHASNPVPHAARCSAPYPGPCLCAALKLQLKRALARAARTGCTAAQLTVTGDASLLPSDSYKRTPGCASRCAVRTGWEQAADRARDRAAASRCFGGGAQGDRGYGSHDAGARHPEQAPGQLHHGAAAQQSGKPLGSSSLRPPSRSKCVTSRAICSIAQLCGKGHFMLPADAACVFDQRMRTALNELSAF